MTRRTAQDIRIEACRCAAAALAGRQADESITPQAWALTVFFEEYIRSGAEGTCKDFGPKRPVKLKAYRG